MRWGLNDAGRIIMRCIRCGYLDMLLAGDGCCTMDEALPLLFFICNRVALWFLFPVGVFSLPNILY